jgi:hypothetical protein
MPESFGLFGAVKGLFEYNRENFIFDRTLNQERVYQIQKMRVAQVRLYRNDLEELFDLTIRKMDSYMIFNALLLLFTAGVFYEGRLPKDTPAWILWLWTMSLGSAFFFLSLSIWFAIHASITAQTFQVRLLTQWLRLPIPSAADIHAAAGTATEFEETRARDMLRVPGVVSVQTGASDPFHCFEKFPDVPNQLLESDLIKDYTLFVEHFYLFRELQKHWQGFDAYCRIGMVIGTNMLLSGLSYMAIAYYVMSFKLFAGLVFPVVLTAFSLIHMRMNLRNLSWLETTVMAGLIVTPMILACIAGVYAMITDSNSCATVLSPPMYIASGAWVLFLAMIGSREDGGLPTQFVTVASIDVLGLEEDDEGRFDVLTRFHSTKGMSSAKLDDDTDSSSVSSGAETPVGVAVPPAPIIARGEEHRRTKERSEQLRFTGESVVTDVDMVDIHNGDLSPIESDIVPPKLEPIPEGILVSSLFPENFEISNEGPQRGLSALGSAPVELNGREEVRAYKHSMKARRLPAHSFKEACGVLICLWVFASTYSVIATTGPCWGWPTTMPTGNGEDE